MASMAAPRGGGRSTGSGRPGARLECETAGAWRAEDVGGEVRGAWIIRSLGKVGRDRGARCNGPGAECPRIDADADRPAGHRRQARSVAAPSAPARSRRRGRGGAGDNHRSIGHHASQQRGERRPGASRGDQVRTTGPGFGGRAEDPCHEQQPCAGWCPDPPLRRKGPRHFRHWPWKLLHSSPRPLADRDAGSGR